MLMIFAIGMAVGALTMQTLDGRELTMSNYAERRGTLMVFFSSRCPVTQAAAGSITSIKEKYRRRGVLSVGLCVNDAESRDEVRAFSQRNDMTFPIYRDPGGAVAKQFGARVTPEAFLLDAKGVLIYRGGFNGTEAVKDLDETIARFLAGEALPRAEFAAEGTPLGTVGTPGSAEDPVQAVVYSSEVIFEKIPWAPDHHCSTIAEAPNGDLLCVWFGGPFESSDDQVLFLARRKQGERTWSTPELFVKGEFLHPAGNAVVFRVSPTRMMVFWDRMDDERPIRAGQWGKGQLMFRYSDDHGYTWSADAELHAAAGGIRNVPITLQNGELFVPMSGGKGSFLITRDQGATWENSGKIDDGGQPTVIQRRDGSLLVYLRSMPYILQSESRDNGRTWTPAKPSSLNCPGASMALCRLRNGHLALVFNDSPVGRTPLSLAISEDEGATWPRKITLESNPGEYAYPCVIQTSDGRIHVTYTFLRRTIKHVELTQDYVHWLAPRS